MACVQEFAEFSGDFQLSGDERPATSPYRHLDYLTKDGRTGETIKQVLNIDAADAGVPLVLSLTFTSKALRRIERVMEFTAIIRPGFSSPVRSGTYYDFGGDPRVVGITVSDCCPAGITVTGGTCSAEICIIGF